MGYSDGYVIIYGSSYICNLPMNKGFKLIEFVNRKVKVSGGVWTLSLKRQNAAIFDSIEDANTFLRYFDGESDGEGHFPMRRCRVVDFNRAPIEL